MSSGSLLIPFLWCCQIGHSFAFATATTISRILHASLCKGILLIILQDINQFFTYYLFYVLCSMFLCLRTGNIALYFAQDPKLLQALVENSKRSIPYAGAFLVKDKEGTDPYAVISSESDNSIHDLKGKELLKCLHDVGTLAQVLGSFAKLVGDISSLMILKCAFHSCLDNKNSRRLGGATGSPSYTTI